jgi:hypothetical protein
MRMEILKVLAGKITIVSSILQIEATMCLEALRFASEQDMMSIEIETYCLNLKNVIRSSEWDTFPEGMLMRELSFSFLVHLTM